jgi:hypothetical protein
MRNRIPRDVTIAYTHSLYLTYTNSVTVSTPGIIGNPFISELYFARRVSYVALLECKQLTGPNYPRSGCDMGARYPLSRPKPPHTNCRQRGVYIQPPLRTQLLRCEAGLDIHRFKGRKQVFTDE